MSAASSISRVRVRYAETDQMGVVYYSNYFVWFEIGRTDLLRAAGWSYREIEADGFSLPGRAGRAGCPTVFARSWACRIESWQSW